MNCLRIVELDRGKYFLDERLQQLRNIENPHDFVDIKDVLDEPSAFGLEPEDELYNKRC